MEDVVQPDKSKEAAARIQALSKVPPVSKNGNKGKQNGNGWEDKVGAALGNVLVTVGVPRIMKLKKQLQQASGDQ